MLNHWAQITSFEGLYQAYLAARKGKRERPEVQCFENDLETRLVELREQLIADQWCPQAYRRFTIYDRKPRQICAAPFADRVVHHALMDTVMPVFEAKLGSSCYACRKGKGVHQAVQGAVLHREQCRQRGRHRHRPAGSGFASRRPTLRAFLFAVLMLPALAFAQTASNADNPLQQQVADAQVTEASSNRDVCQPDPAAGPELVIVPPGAFVMGSDADNSEPDERPSHEVQIS